MDDERPIEDSNSNRPPDVSPWTLAGLGVQFCVALLLSLYAGQWMDKRLGTAPVFLLLAVVVGGGGTFALSVRRLTRPTLTQTHGGR